MENGQPVEDSYYIFAPNKGAAIFFCIAFAAIGAVHSYQAIVYRCKLLTPLLPFCCALFATGFALRAYGAWHYDNLNIYIASICITYAAPPLLELQNYRILGRILYYVPYLSPLHPGRVLTTFGFLSAIVEALNGWGASYSANQSLSQSQMNVGRGLIKASLIIQIFVIAAFVLLAVTFHRRCNAQGISSSRLRTPLLMLYVSITLILVRTIYRIVEYFSVASVNWHEDVDVQGLSPIVRYEWFFYVFEATVMFINCVLFNIFHPRRFLPESNKIYLKPDGVTEVTGPGFKDDRPFIVTLLDPFDIRGMLHGSRKSQMNNFWDESPTTTDGPLKSPEAETARASGGAESV